MAGMLRNTRETVRQTAAAVSDRVDDAAEQLRQLADRAGRAYVLTVAVLTLVGLAVAVALYRTRRDQA